MSSAVVLSGGGSVGIAWQTGLAAGLADKGVDLRTADLVVGTSAGSATGAQMALGFEMMRRVEAYDRTPSVRNTPDEGAAPGPSMLERMAPLMEFMSKPPEGDPEEVRRAIGRFALEADTGPEDRFVAAFSYLDGHDFPSGYTCTAVDAESGEFRAWDADAGVDLPRAVASSCCVPGLFPPITIDGRRYIDGGMRSGTNADLAAGHDRVLIVSLMGARPSDDPRAARARVALDREMQALTDAGAEVRVLGVDDAAAAVIGVNLMDAARAPDAARAGVEQGRREAAALAEFWS